MERHINSVISKIFTEKDIHAQYLYHSVFQIQQFTEEILEGITVMRMELHEEIIYQWFRVLSYVIFA